MEICVHASLSNIFNKCYKRFVFLKKNKLNFWCAKYEDFFFGGVIFYMLEDSFACAR